MKKRSAFSLLTSCAQGVRHCYVIAVITMLISILLTFLSPQIIRFAVDSVIGDKEFQAPAFLTAAFDQIGGWDALRQNIVFCALALLLCAILAGLFNYNSLMNLTYGTEKLTKKLRDRLFAHIQHLPFKWHTDSYTGDIIQRCTSDVETVHTFIARHLIEIVRTIIFVISALVLMFSMNIKLTLVSAAFIPFIISYSLLFHRRVSKQFLQADEAEGALMVAIQENLTGVRVVRAFGREKHELKGFGKKLDAFTNKWIDLGYTLGFYWGIGDFATGSQLLAVVCAGAFWAAQGRLTLGELLAFIFYTQLLTEPVRGLGRRLSELSKTGVSMKRICEIVDAQVEKEPLDVLMPDLSADIEFKDVCFAYGEKEILSNINFKVKRGSTFGILGSTGSGKSTITYLLNRLYELPPGGGSIEIGGIDIRNISRDHLRRSVGLVLQEPFLFSKTIKENIAIASASGDLDKIRKAADIAAVDDNIMDFGDGYDTMVGERGITLSGGQKQRIAIARTLMLDCPIMVFDDSTSSVDMETDEKIRLALRENSGDATVILISHRINTLMQAEAIIVLHDGKIIQSGTHEELLHEEGTYRRVYKMQSDAGLGNR
ncbi:MAG: ABC transporter ATP-binding protein/permease [Clostridiales bacterium]|nr:ABC transporter ATP-binding protein/permease [Clostridiales bacterium]